MRQTKRSEERRLGEALRTGGQILIDQLVIQGVERVYCVPGESFLAALDAMNDTPIEVTVCRQEAGAAMMALTEGRLTGRPGICFVTRGPGATNAAHGVHIAEHDSAPMILFVGQVERAMMGRGAFQEMDYRALFASTAKLATQIETAAQVPEIIQRAFHAAMQGRPGPVVIALPEDMLTEMAAVTDAPRVEPAPIWPGLTQMAELQKMLWASERPIAILGGGGWTKRASAAFARFAERFDLPVVGSFRRASAFDGEHDNLSPARSASPNPKLKARVERPISCCWSAAACRRRRRRATRCSIFRRRASGWSTSMPTPTRSAATIIPRSASSRPRPLLRRARRRAAAGDDPLVAGGGRRAPTISPGASRRRQIRAGCS
jgi:hypothetical protein